MGYKKPIYFSFLSFLLALIFPTLILLFFILYRKCSVVKKSLYYLRPVPTLLSIVDPISESYIDAFQNTLYEVFKDATDIEQNYFGADEELPQELTLDKAKIETLRQSLTLTWKIPSNQVSSLHTDSQDIIALYCPSTSDHDDFLEVATLEQIHVTSMRNGGSKENEWFIPSFPFFRHETCQFRYFDLRLNGTLQLLASSPILQLPSSKTPTNIHLAYSNSYKEMVIQFNTGAKGKPIAFFGTSDKSMDSKVEGESHTYTAGDLCGAPANKSGAGKFQDPGFFHVITLKNLLPNRSYNYKVGLASGQGVIWSETFSFLSPLPVGDQQEPFSYVVYSDQGCPAVGQENGGARTAAMIAREKNIRAVHHFGGLSYAMGASHIWDEWMHMIEPFASKVPIMVGVGNPEYDYIEGGQGKDPSGANFDHGFMPEWGNFGAGSGGECGIPATNRFTMPSSPGSNGIFWYSHDFASVHTIMLSSEHNITKGSKQHEWFLEDLRNVNRSLTPWLIVELHRPLYESEFIWDDNFVGVGMRYEIEELLYKFNVDIVLAGHYHSYLRTCDGLYKSKCQNGGPMHICVGSAGAKLDVAMLYPQNWTDIYIEQEFGYGRITVFNSSTLHFEFVQAREETDRRAGKVRDDFWIVRDR